jgi:hypothetical protein
MSNTLSALWIGLSVGLLLLFFYAAYLNWRNRRIHSVDLGDLLPSFLPVDTQALAELANPAHEQRLKPEGWSEDLPRVQRERIRVAADCLHRMAHNAALLQQLGYSHLHSPNQLIQSLAQEMIDAGVHVRLYSFIGLARLHLGKYLSWELPALRHMLEIDDLLSSSLIPAYDALKNKAGNLTCLKFSSLHEEFVNSL